MEDKKLSEFEYLADYYGFEEDSCGIWKSPYVEFKLDGSHVWRMRHRKTDDKAWILLRDGVIVAMAKESSTFLLLAAANGINIKEDPAESYFDLSRSFWSFQTF